MEVVLTGFSVDTTERAPIVSMVGVSTPIPEVSFGVIQGTGIELPDPINLSDYEALPVKKDIYYFIGG